MEFGLSLEIGADVYGKAEILNRLSKDLEHYFKNKHFGTGLKSLTIGITCVPPEMESFFKVRSKYYKTTKVLGYDVKLTYETIRNADEPGVLAAVREAI